MDRSAEVSVQRAVLGVQPRSVAALHGWLRAVLGIEVPWAPRCEEHGGPMDYLRASLFEDEDVVVWANRGGGKTFYGAVATLLDMLFKPGIEVRILGGSLEQSQQMYRHLRWMLDREAVRPLIDGRLTERGVRLINGSRVELLAQSETSVRGHRVQKLRCDEVELFDRDVWAAAQYVTRSADCGGVWVKGAVEAMSTMHRPFGLMSELVESAKADEGRRLVEWCVLDVMGRCASERECGRCVLWEPCGGRAKRWRGFVPVSDVIAQRRRSSREGFEAEMLCRRPSRSDAVFPRFDPAVHVQPVEADDRLTWIGGMDFGIRSPLVMLWAQVRELGEGCRRVEVVDEYVRAEEPMVEHLREVRWRGWPKLAWIGVDPAGRQRSADTGRSSVGLLREAGYRVRAGRKPISEGIDLLRRMLEPIEPGSGSSEPEGASGLPGSGVEQGGASQGSTGRQAATGPRAVDGSDAVDEGVIDLNGPGLVIHPRCQKLIESLTCYHFDADRPEREHPVKDGHDHCVDALRYMVQNLGAASRAVVRGY